MNVNVEDKSWRNVKYLWIVCYDCT